MKITDVSKQTFVDLVNDAESQEPILMVRGKTPKQVLATLKASLTRVENKVLDFLLNNQSVVISSQPAKDQTTETDIASVVSMTQYKIHQLIEDMKEDDVWDHFLAHGTTLDLYLGALDKSIPTLH